MRRSFAAVIAIMLAACGGEDQRGGAPPPVSPVACSPLEVSLFDGTCLRAGVPDDGCGEGFEPDGAAGCVAVLPLEGCGPGLMALPGDTECEPVSPCAEGTWGDVPIDASTQLVDASYGGGDSDGSSARPWTSIQAAIDAATSDATIAIAEGTYGESLEVGGKAVTLWGRCPSLVEVAGDPGQAALFLRAGSQGSVVRGLALTSGAAGIATAGTSDVLFEHLWVHDTTQFGAAIQSMPAGGTFVLRRSLFENIRGTAVFAGGVTLEAEDLVVRDTAMSASGEFGIGVAFQFGTTATLRRALIVGHRQSSLTVVDSEVVADSLAIFDTLGLDDGTGAGVDVHAVDGTVALTLTGSVVANSSQIGIVVDGGNCFLDRTVVRDTVPRAADGGEGIGVAATKSDASFAKSALAVSNCLVERSHDFGIFYDGADGGIANSIVRDVRADSVSAAGHGIAVQDEPDYDERSVVTIAGTIVERSHESGIFVGGSDATIGTTTVRDVLPNPHSGNHGCGIAVQNRFPQEPAIAALSDVLLERNHMVGLLANGAIVSADRLVVRQTASLGGDSGFGDGIVGIVVDGTPVAIDLVRSIVEDNERVGLGSFGADIAVADSVIGCNAIALNAEEGGVISDLGGNDCGCAKGASCKVLSNSLEPPAPVLTP
jgi:hypothetical protein